MVKLDRTSIKFKEEMIRFRNNLPLLSYIQEKASCLTRTVESWLSELLCKGIRVQPQGRKGEFVYMCIWGGIKIKCLVKSFWF